MRPDRQHLVYFQFRGFPSASQASVDSSRRERVASVLASLSAIARLT
jgi:hypothetical protein